MGRTLEGIALTGRHEMWNAGVIGLPASMAAERVAQALQLCDAMCATDCPRRLIEQFAFSLALQQGTLHPCQDVIGHYWGNKPAWNRLIAGFLAEARLKDETVAQAVARLGQVDWRALPLEAPAAALGAAPQGRDRLGAASQEAAPLHARMMS